MSLTHEISLAAVQDIVIDCDPGIDDALALMLAAGSPELRLRGVTCVAGNRPVDIATGNACRVLAAAGRHDVPVFAGCARPLAHVQPRCNLVHGADGLGGAALPAAPPAQSGHAVDFLVEALKAVDPPTLIAIGPLTNLAMAEIRDPGVLRRAPRLLVMGGAFFCPGNITPDAEFNFYADAVAAHVVLTSGARLTLFGLDVTSRAHMTAAWIASLAALPGVSGRAAHAMLAAYAEQDPLLHDACPVAYAIDPALFDGEPCATAVDWREGATEGHATAWGAGRGDAPGPPNATVMREVQRDALLALVRERLARLP